MPPAPHSMEPIFNSQTASPGAESRSTCFEVPGSVPLELARRCGSSPLVPILRHLNPLVKGVTKIAKSLMVAPDFAC